jgi:hypothetical protein
LYQRSAFYIAFLRRASRAVTASPERCKIERYCAGKAVELGVNTQIKWLEPIASALRGPFLLDEEYPDEYEDEDNPGMNQYGEEYVGRRGPSIREIDEQNDWEDERLRRLAMRRARPIIEQIKALPDPEDRQIILRWFMTYVHDGGAMTGRSVRRRTVDWYGERGYSETYWLVLRASAYDDYDDPEDDWHKSK